MVSQLLFPGSMVHRPDEAHPSVRTSQVFGFPFSAFFAFFAVNSIALSKFNIPMLSACRSSPRHAHRPNAQGTPVSRRNPRPTDSSNVLVLPTISGFSIIAAFLSPSLGREIGRRWDPPQARYRSVKNREMPGFGGATTCRSSSNSTSGGPENRKDGRSD